MKNGEALQTNNIDVNTEQHKSILTQHDYDTLKVEVEGVNCMIGQSNISDEYTLALVKNSKKKYILNKFAPRTQAINIIGEDLKNYDSVWVVIGFNFGYGIDYLRTMVDERVNVIVVEPNREILDIQREYSPYNFDANENIYFFSGYDFVKLHELVSKLAGNLNFNNIHIRADKYYLDLYPHYLKQVTTTINDYISDIIINFNTVSVYRMLWIKNAILNRDKVAQTCDLTHIYKKYTNVPAVIVSAGPSLKKNIELLKEFKGIIICMGRTLDALMDIGVKPDFVCCVDPTDLIYETFGRHKEHDIPLLNIAYGNPKVTHGAKGEVYLMSNSATVMNILNLRVNPGLSCSGSVATLCCSLAEHLGANPIIFLGQDLAYTNNERHSSLTLMKEETNEKIEPQKPKMTKGFYGELVETDAVFNSFRKWFENFIEQTPEVTFINATEGGAYINGAKHMSFRECLDKYCTLKERPIIEHKRLYEDEEIDPDAAIEGAIYTLKRIKQLTRKGKIYYRQLVNATNHVHIEKLEKEIAIIDKKLLKLDRGEELISLLMEDIAYAIAGCNDSKEPINETLEARNKRIYRLQAETYECLEQESEKVIKVIEEALEEEKKEKKDDKDKSLSESVMKKQKR